MTYALSWPLQKAVFALVAGDPGIAALATGGVHDEPPHGADPGGIDGPYIVLGDENVSAWSDASCDGAVHSLQISAIADNDGFAVLKQIGGRVSDLLIDAEPELDRGRVVSANFIGGLTRRIDQGRRRRLDLRFRIVVEDDPSS